MFAGLGKLKLFQHLTCIQQSAIKTILITLATVLIASVIILSYVPPVSRDALTHHLAVPNLYIKHGSVYEIPDIEFSYFPMNLDILYMVPLYFGNDIAPKFIHFSFALLTVWLLFSFLKKRLNTLYALTGILFFLSLPIIVKLSIMVYVDLGLIFFSTASLIYFLKWIEENFKLRFLILSAVWCGLALGTKYNGLIVCFLLTLFVPFIYSISSFSKSDTPSSFILHPSFRAAGYGAVFLFVALLVFSPWMIKNYIWTDNPIFPLYDNCFNRADDSARKINHFTLRSVNFNESSWQIALIPLRIFFQGRDGSPKYFDGKLNPLLFILPFFAFLGSGKNKALMTEKKILLAYAVLFILFAFFTTDMRIRYISPIIPPLVILSVFGLYNINTFFREQCSVLSGKAGLCAVFVALCFLTGMNAVYITEQFRYVDPIPYIRGKVGRDEYIERYRHEYPAIQFANKNLPGSAKILGIFLGNRRYYSDREMFFDMNLFRKIVKQANSPEKIMSELNKKDITHILIRYDLFNKWCDTNFDDNSKKMLKIFFKEHLKLLFYKGGYGLSEIYNGKAP